MLEKIINKDLGRMKINLIPLTIMNTFRNVDFYFGLSVLLRI